ERYSDRIDEPGLKGAVARILEDVPGARHMLGNPMQLTLLLYLLATGARVDPINVQEPYSLYSTFYREWMKKERSRGTGGFHPETVSQAHIRLARWLYENRGEIAALSDILAARDFPDQNALLQDSAFMGLLLLDEGDSGEHVLVSFRHETIEEFLIARDILG